MDGVLDLSQLQDSNEWIVPLNGEWAFRWDSTRSTVNVPGNWSAYTMAPAWFPLDTGQACYALRIVLPEGGGQWHMRLPTIHSAYVLTVNGDTVCRSGRMAPFEQPALLPKTVTFSASERAIDLQLHISNYHFVNGGIASPILFGRGNGLHRIVDNNKSMIAIQLGGLVIMGLYQFGFFLLRRRDYGHLAFAVFCMAIAIRLLFIDDALFFQLWPDSPYVLSIRILFSTFPIAYAASNFYIRSIYAYRYPPALTWMATGAALAYLGLVWLTPPLVFARYLSLLGAVSLVSLAFYIKLLFSMWRDDRLTVSLIVGSMVMFVCCILNDFLHQAAMVQTSYTVPAGALLFVICQALVLAVRFTKVTRKSERLNLDLDKVSLAYREAEFQRNIAVQRQEIVELKNRFFANITHEFRTPLTLIIGPTEKLTGSSQLPPPQRAAVATIRRNAQQLLVLVNQMLDLAKLDEHTLPVNEQPGRLDELIAQVVLSFQESATARSISLRHVYHESTVPRLLFDQKKLEIICYNLLSNALKYTAVGGDVRIQAAVRVEGDTAEVSLHVADNGPGIPQEDLPYVFDRYFQGKNPVNSHGGGTGIGLHVTRELVTLTDGAISVSSALGEGTVFSIKWYFAVVEGEDGEANATPLQDCLTITYNKNDDALPEVSPPIGNRQTILVVEDHAELNGYLCQELGTDYVIRMALDGDQGWRRIQEEMPDLVITDVMMPLIDGNALCHRIKTDQVTEHIPVLMLTAKVQQNDVLTGLGTGANDYIAKPFHMGELKLRIANLLNHQERQRRHYHALLTQSGVPSASQPTTQHPILAALYQYLEQQLDNPSLQVQDLADKLAMSSRTLSRKLQAIAGISPSELVTTYRMQQAARLLAEGNNVSQTAYLVGYTDPSWFSKSFKEFHQKPPSAYLKA